MEIIFYFLTNRLNGTVLLSTQNICSKLWVRKYLLFYTENCVAEDQRLVQGIYFKNSARKLLLLLLLLLLLFSVCLFFLQNFKIHSLVMIRF